MDSGTKVYEGYVGVNPENHWINEGVVTEIIADGVPLVRYGDLLLPLSPRWHPTRAGAKRDIHTALIRHIGRLQAIADEMKEEILHEDLTAAEAVA